MMRFNTLVSMAIVGFVSLVPADLQAQNPRSDSADAVTHAKQDARDAFVAHYGVASAVVTPVTLGTLLVVLAGENLSRSMIPGPVAMIGMTAAASKAGVPDRLETRIADRDSAYQAVYREAYTDAVVKRRRSAMMFGGLVGVVGSVLFLIAAFGDGYT